MPTPTDPADLDYAIELYLAGKPIQEVAAKSGVSLSRFYRERNARGVPSRKSHILDVDQIVSAYNSGASENALAIQYGVSRPVIAKRLVDAGVIRRGSSQAGIVRNSHMSTDERKAQAAAANRAARLRRASNIDKLRCALRREASGNFDSDGERLMFDYLDRRGVKATPQRAVGVYNVDLAILPVAVEILGGVWHSLKTTHAHRTPYILDEGWHLIMVWDYEGRGALGEGAADYVVSFLEEIGRTPPATCQYRVITGQGELLAARGREDDEFPVEPPPRGR